MVIAVKMTKQPMSKERRRERNEMTVTQKKRWKKGDEWLTWLWCRNCVCQDIRSYHNGACLIGSQHANMNSAFNFLPFRSVPSLSLSLLPPSFRVCVCVYLLCVCTLCYILLGSQMSSQGHRDAKGGDILSKGIWGFILGSVEWKITTFGEPRKIPNM